MVTISARRVGRATFELAPGHTKKGITARQAKTILSSVRPRDAVGRTRKRLVLEQFAEIVGIERTPPPSSSPWSSPAARA